MHRSIAFIERLITTIGVAESSVKSIRLSNEAPENISIDSIRVEINFLSSGIDDFFHQTVNSTGFFVDDVIAISSEGYRSRSATELKSIRFEGEVQVVQIFFSNERNITADKLKSALITETAFGLPAALTKLLPVSKIKFYFGSNQQPMNLSAADAGVVSVHNDIAFMQEQIESPYIEWRWIAPNGKISVKRVELTEYTSASNRDLLKRFSLTPKIGFKVYGFFSPELMTQSVPCLDWTNLVNNINQKVESYVERYTRDQVARVSSRINRVHHRPDVFYKNRNISKEPENEVETVILFDRLCRTENMSFPGGLKVKILDYSPKDIDSICEISISPDSPALVGPVEFEYAIKSFFDHGHDYRQVKLIICYTVGSLAFPYTTGGITYMLDLSQGLPKLRNSNDEMSVPCLILDRIVKKNAIAN